MSQITQVFRPHFQFLVRMTTLKRFGGHNSCVTHVRWETCSKNPTGCVIRVPLMTLWTYRSACLTIRAVFAVASAHRTEYRPYAHANAITFEDKCKIMWTRNVIWIDMEMCQHCQLTGITIIWCVRQQYGIWLGFHFTWFRLRHNVARCGKGVTVTASHAECAIDE